MKRLNSIIICFAVLLSLETVCLGEFVKGPYLQNVTQSSIVICFETSEPTEAIVHYGIDSFAELSISDTQVKTFHEINITGLSVGTNYLYRITAGDDTAGATFSTAPTVDSDFTFVAYGDNQRGDKVVDEHIASTALIVSLNPDILVNVGDLWSRNEVDYVQIFFDIEKNLIKNKCLFPAKGNHEYGGTFPPDYFSMYFSFPDNLTSNEDDAYYSFDYGNSHFLIINNALGVAPLIGTPIIGAQLDAIISDLQQANDNPDIVHIFVVMHRAAHSNGSLHGSKENPALSQVLGPIFLEHNVDIVFQGHDHNYERFEPEGITGSLGDPPNGPDGYDVIADGVTYVVTGAAGAGFYNVPVPPAPTTETSATPNLTSRVAETVTEAMLIEVTGRKVTATTFLTDGSILDKFTVLRNIDCIEYPTMDANKDCKVDLLDLAELASQWLTCNYDPPEACYL